MTSPAELADRAVHWFDGVQARHAWISQPVGTIRKYADDRGSAFAGLVTYQLFLGLLPLLVVVLTVLARLTKGSVHLRQAVVDSALSQFPVIGERIQDDISTIGASGPWLILSVTALLWTATGIYKSTQLALNQTWNVQGVRRQGFVERQLRALLLFALVICAATGGAVLPLGALVRPFPSPAAAVVTPILGAVVAAVLLLGVFRLAVSTAVPTRSLLPAALLAGLLWELLQLIGSDVVAGKLADASDLYGTIGTVVVVLSWINLLARSMLLANEWAVVGLRQLWPRHLAQPPLSGADRRVLRALDENERRRPEEHIIVGFDDRH